MEKSTNEGESPVCHLQSSVYGVLSKSHVPRAWSAKGGKFHLKLNIGLRPIANKYHEGKMKRTLERGRKCLKLLKGKQMEAVYFGEIVAY